MALGSIDDFKSRLTGGGARGNLFQVVLANPLVLQSNKIDIGDASYLCEAASLPASTLGVIEIPFRGKKLKYPGDRTFDVWTVTIINDTGFSIRTPFEAWSNAIQNHSDAGGTQNPAAYMVDLTVDQFDRGDSQGVADIDRSNIIKSYSLRGAWPSEVGQIELSYADDNIERFQVTFQYQYWTSDGVTDGRFGS